MVQGGAKSAASRRGAVGDVNVPEVSALSTAFFLSITNITSNWEI